MSDNEVLMLLSMLIMSSIISTSGGHYLVISEKNIISLSDNFNETASHKLTTKFPLLCKRVPTNCRPFLFPFLNDTVMLIPSDDIVKFFNTDIKFLTELSLSKCFRYFPTGNSNNEFYALCLRNYTYETFIAIYKIQDFRLVAYSNETYIDLDSPLIVTFNDSNDPVVLYIADVRGNAKLFIKPELNAGGDTVSLPSDCSGPYQLRHLHQLDALLKCYNGSVYFYNGYTRVFTKVPVRQRVSMVERCAESSSFVMITTQGDILLYKTSSEPLTPSYVIDTTSFQPNAVSSFTCHWNGTVTNLYFTIPQNDGTIHYMSIPLERYAVIPNNVTASHLLLRLSNHKHSFDTLQSSIVGSAWVIQLFDSGHNVQETVLIDIYTGISSILHTSDGISYVLYVKPINDSNYGEEGGLPFDNPKEPDEKLPVHHNMAAAVSGAAGAVMMIFIVILVVIFCVIKRRHKRDPGNSRRRLELENCSTIQTDLHDRQVPEDETTFSGNQSGYDSNKTQISIADNDVPITHDQGCQTIHDADQGIYQTIPDAYPVAASSSYDCNQSLTNDQNENTGTTMHGQALASNDHDPANDQNSQTIIDADQGKFDNFQTTIDGSHPFAISDHHDDQSPANDQSVIIDTYTPTDDQALASSLSAVQSICVGGQENYQTTTSDCSCASDDHDDDQSPAHNDQSGDVSTHTPTYCDDDLYTLASNEGSSVETRSFASNKSTDIPSQCVVGHQPSIPFVIQ